MIKRVFLHVSILSLFLPALLLFQTNYGMKNKNVKKESDSITGKKVLIDSQVYCDLKKLIKKIDYLKYLRMRKNIDLEEGTLEEAIVICERISKSLSN